MTHAIFFACNSCGEHALGQVALSAVFGEKDLRREAVSDRPQPVGKRGGFAAWSLKVGVVDTGDIARYPAEHGWIDSMHEHLLRVRATGRVAGSNDPS